MGAGWGEEPGCCDINIFSFSANTGINNDWNENKKFRVDAKSGGSQRGSGDSRLLLWRARRERNTGLLCDGIVVVFLDAIASLLSTEEFSEVTFLNLLMVFLYVLSVLIDWKTG